MILDYSKLFFPLSNQDARQYELHFSCKSNECKTPEMIADTEILCFDLEMLTFSRLETKSSPLGENYTEIPGSSNSFDKKT